VAVFPTVRRATALHIIPFLERGLLMVRGVLGDLSMLRAPVPCPVSLLTAARRSETFASSEPQPRSGTSGAIFESAPFLFNPEDHLISLSILLLLVESRSFESLIFNRPYSHRPENSDTGVGLPFRHRRPSIKLDLSDSFRIFLAPDGGVHLILSFQRPYPGPGPFLCCCVFAL